MSKGTILVVDADEDIRKMLDVYFSELGYEVKTFSNRDGMLEIAEHESPDVVLLAVHHLILSVSEANFVTNWNRNDTVKAIPIIFLHPKRPDEFYIGDPIIINEDDFVSVPFDIEELELRIKNAINKG